MHLVSAAVTLAHYTETGEPTSVAQRPGSKEQYLLTALSISFVLGMGVAVGVYSAWKFGAIAPGLHDVLSAVALLVCPPFILSAAVGPTPDSDLALTLIVGTIVFANGFLYAGVAAVGYFVVTVLATKKTSGGARP
ncbi:MAG: hypothetical protein ACLPPV_19255 [Candidatus Korobacteraceae bacterium]|jgi:hypothetical protein